MDRLYPLQKSGMVVNADCFPDRFSKKAIARDELVKIEPKNTWHTCLWLGHNLFGWDYKNHQKYYIFWSLTANLVIPKFREPTAEEYSGKNGCRALEWHGFLAPPLCNPEPSFINADMWKVKELGKTDSTPYKTIFARALVVIAAYDNGHLQGYSCVRKQIGIDQHYYGQDKSQLGLTASSKHYDLKILGPMLQDLRILIYDDPWSDIPKVRRPEYNEVTGIWSARFRRSIVDRKYYLLETKAYRPPQDKERLGSLYSGRVMTFLSNDPRAVCLSANGERSQFVDLNDDDLKPDGYDKISLRLPERKDAVILELHVGDVSYMDPCVPEADRGKYAPLYNPESSIRTALKKAASHGVNYVHLMPTIDFGMVEERPDAQNHVDFEELKQFPEDSTEQQELTSGCNFRNWGYNPRNHMVPSGLYSKAPDSTLRIYEFRKLVLSLLEIDMFVILDPVLNHFSGLGQSCAWDLVMPGYAIRLTKDGAPYTDSCCPDTATEFKFLREYFLDVAEHWMLQYMVPGFRIDLGNFHDIDFLRELSQRLTRISAMKDRDNEFILYIEGWEHHGSANHKKLDYASAWRVGDFGHLLTPIGAYNPEFKYALLGENNKNYHENTAVKGYLTDGLGSQRAGKRLIDMIKVGMAGGLRDYQLHTAQGIKKGSELGGKFILPQQCHQYPLNHDNNLLFPLLIQKMHYADLDTIVRTQVMVVGLVLLSQGIPTLFFPDLLLHAGGYDVNPYATSPWFTALRWADPEKVTEQYRGVIYDNSAATGLPPLHNESLSREFLNWVFAQKRLRPSMEQIEFAYEWIWEYFDIRKSSDLFKLQNPEHVYSMVNFFNNGDPEIITMVIQDLAQVDQNFSAVAVVINPTYQTRSSHVGEFNLPAYNWVLHPVQSKSIDSKIRENAFFCQESGLVVPPKSVAVFVAYK